MFINLSIYYLFIKLYEYFLLVILAGLTLGISAIAALIMLLQPRTGENFHAFEAALAQDERMYAREGIRMDMQGLPGRPHHLSRYGCKCR